MTDAAQLPEQAVRPRVATPLGPKDGLRVLLVTGSFPPMRCGVGDYTAHLARALSEMEGIQVGVVTRREGRGLAAAANVRVMAVADRWRMTELPRVLGSIRAFRPEIVHCQFPTRGYRGILPWLLPVVTRLIGLPTVQTWHEYYPKHAVGWRQILAAPGLQGMIAVRPGYLESLPMWLRRWIEVQPFALIPNASALPRAEMTALDRSLLRSQLGPGGRQLVAFFGFLQPHKGADLLFDVANPTEHSLVFVGDLDRADPYHDMLWKRSQEKDWRGKVRFTGFLTDVEAAEVLTVADAVVLPFRGGGGMWNTSVRGAVAQGTFVLTTSEVDRGYDHASNTYYASPQDVEDMAKALAEHGGKKTAAGTDPGSAWREVALLHVRFYRRVLAS